MSRVITVLIVDDHHETRENLFYMLQYAPEINPVARASSGIEALDMARLHKPDVVLMDINLPGIDGINASQDILRAVPSTKIVMMSGQNETDYQWGSMLVGASSFLTKPFTADELLATIQKAVSA